MEINQLNMLIYFIGAVGVYLLMEISNVGYRIIKAIKVRDDKKELDEHLSSYRIRAILSLVTFVIVTLVTLYKLGISLH